MSGRWEGPGEQLIRSLLTPTRDDLQRYAADQGRFESHLLHWGPPRKAPGEIRLRVPGGTFGPDPAAYRAALHAVKALVGTEPQPSR